MAEPGLPEALSKEASASRGWLIWAVCLVVIWVLYTSRLFAFFSALPVLYLALRQGMFPAIFLLLSAVFLIFPSNPLDAGTLLFFMGTSTLVAGATLRKSQKISRAIFNGVLTVSLLFCVIFVAWKFFGLPERLPWAQEMVRQLGENVDHFYQELDQLAQKNQDQPPRTVEESQAEQIFFRSWALALLPGGFVSVMALSLWIYLILLRPTATQLGFSESYERLDIWQSPYPLVWLVIVILSALIFRFEPVKIPAINALIVLATVYLFQGIAILVYFMKQQQFSPGWRLLCYVMAILFFKVVALLLIGVGFFDVWFNFRKLKDGVA